MICRGFCFQSNRKYKKNKCSTKTVLLDHISVMLFSERKLVLKGENSMKGYTVESGYMGYVNGGYMLFASEMDYEEYMEMDSI